MNAVASPPARTVLDTNVWLDWLVFDDPGVRPIVDAALAGRLAILGCPSIRNELAEVLSRDAIARHAQRARERRGLAAQILDVPALLGRFDALTTACASPPPCEPKCSDPDDQVFLELAAAQRARWLITKDRALLALARHARRLHGVEVVTPKGFTLL